MGMGNLAHGINSPPMIPERFNCCKFEESTALLDHRSASSAQDGILQRKGCGGPDSDSAPEEFEATDPFPSDVDIYTSKGSTKGKTPKPRLVRGSGKNGKSRETGVEGMVLDKRSSLLAATLT